MYKFIGSAALFLALGAQSTASAQTTAPAPRPPRIWVNLSAGSTSGGQDLNVASTFSLYEEQGSFEASQSIEKGLTADGTVLVRVWRDFLAGVGVSGLNSRSNGTYSLTVPHPLAYDQPRSVTGEVESMRTNWPEAEVTSQRMMSFQVRSLLRT